MNISRSPSYLSDTSDQNLPPAQLPSIPPIFPQEQVSSKYPQGQSYPKKSKGKTFQFKYKIEKSVEERKLEFDKIRNEFPNKIPIICEKDPRSNIRDIGKSKYLFDKDLSLSKFCLRLRHMIKLEKETALFLLVNGRISLTGNSILSDIYNMYKDPEDGFLYITYFSELTWG